jgi:hypothetical protein
VSRHDRLKHCSSVPDLIGLHLLVEYCGRGDLAPGSVPLQEGARAMISGVNRV